MTSSTSCSSRRRPQVAALFLVAAVAACAGSTPRPPPTPRGRVALFPPDNLSDGPAPTRELVAPIELVLSRAGLEVVSGARVEEFLAKRRVRYTGGIDRATARAARVELGIDGVVITSVKRHAASPVPAVAIAMRLVSTDGEPAIVWMGEAARAGNDSPGLLGLGAVEEVKPLERDVIARLQRSLGDFLENPSRHQEPCAGGRRFRPRIAFRSPRLDDGGARSVAVLPFRNLTTRRGAGESVALELARQLTPVEGFRVLEPGVVRGELIAHRVVMEGGVSLDTARVALGTLGAELVVAGDVLAFQDGDGTRPPRAGFSVYVLDTRTNEVVWESTSQSAGNDGVFLFDFGKVSTVTALTCRMVHEVSHGMAGPTRREARPVRFPGPAPATDADVGGFPHRLRPSAN